MTLLTELKRHAPFTLLGAFTGIAIAGAFAAGGLERTWAVRLFWGLHPLHVLLSAVATTSLFRYRARAGWISSVVVGYIGAVGIATLSDCVIPYVGEWLVGLPNRGIHIGFIEKWWLVNPFVLVGIGAAWLFPLSTVSHAGHVLLSTWASLFHMQMAIGDRWTLAAVAVLPVFLFLAVWVPCCTSDIVLPVLFGGIAERRADVVSSLPPSGRKGEPT